MTDQAELRTDEPDQPVRAGERWWTRLPRSARTVRVLAASAPLAACTMASVAVAFLLPPPSRALSTLLWWLSVLGVGVVVLLAVRRVTVRLTPLAALLDLTLVFPDEAPSRFAIARRARSVDEALDVLEDLDEASSVQAAAEASLALVIALETHDSATRGHAERVRLLADLVGQEIGVTREDRVRLRWGALLHDLGKLEVHGDILNKPGRPTEDEWEQLRRHPLEGDRLVQPLRPWLGDWVNAVVEHHERFDGGGYPHGRARSEISLAGRIVGVVDAYETMTARRPYKQPRSAEDARRELVACAGTQFDPDVVRAMLSVSIPAPSRRTLLLGWLAQLPIVAWTGRLPRESTAAMLGAGAAAATLVASGLSPAPAPPVAGPADDPPALAVDEPRAAQEPAEGSASRSRTGQPTTTSPADLPATKAADTQQPSAGPVAPEQAEPDPPDETPGRSPAAPSDSDTEDARHHRATHSVATALYLANAESNERPWLPLTSEQPPDGEVPDADDDGRPGVRLPAARGPDRRPPTPAWTSHVPTTVMVSGHARAVLHIAGTQDNQRIELVVELLDCAPDLRACRSLATGATTATAGPASDGWTQVTISLGPLTALVGEDRVLTAVVTAQPSPAETLLATSTVTTPSRITGLSLVPDHLSDPVATARPPSTGRSASAAAGAATSRTPRQDADRTAAPGR